MWFGCEDVKRVLGGNIECCDGCRGEVEYFESKGESWPHGIEIYWDMHGDGSPGIDGVCIRCCCGTHNAIRKLCRGEVGDLMRKLKREKENDN